MNDFSTTINLALNSPITKKGARHVCFNE